MTRSERKHNFERLGILYALALLSIAAAIIVSQVFTQQYLSHQESDSRVINLAGRQRMLSQQISKLALQIGQDSSANLRQQYAERLESALTRWEESHEGLQHGSDRLGIRRENSAVVDSMFRQIEPNYQALRDAAQQLIFTTQNSTDRLPRSGQLAIDTILAHESPFLQTMDDIVFRYDAEARERVLQLRQIELMLLGLSLIVILLELLFIFWPTVQQIRKTIHQMTESEQTAQELAYEIGVLYNSLENSYQELATVRVEESLPRVYAQVDQHGCFTYVSDAFCQVLEYNLALSHSNLFRWLEQEGYASDHVESIARMAQQGQCWNGEVKALSESGDFVWLDMNIVPTLNENHQVVSCQVVCTDKTERKEAEVRSHEITRDKIEEKLKEQRFRSILILEGQEEERRRISRDIHDGIGQLLTALKFKIEAIDLAPDFPARERKVAAARSMLNQVIREVRRVSFNLNPSALTDYGIVPVTKRFCSEAGRLSDKQVAFENRTGFINRMDKKVETHLYRIIQEGVNNAIKYSQAQEIKVTFSHNSRYLNVDITDDGVGFEHAARQLRPEPINGSGFGIFNMRERASFINGTLTIDSAPGRGTTVNIHIPIQEKS